MQFKDVIGQESIKEKLANLVKHNRLSHALLFLGKEGSGNLPLALAFSQYLLCTGKSNTSSSQSLFGEVADIGQNDIANDSCGKCPSCLKAEKFVHPDIHFSFPSIPKKSGEAPVSNDYIKDFRTFISEMPYGNNYDWLQFIDAENKQGKITARECDDIIHSLSLKSFEGSNKVLIMWMPEAMGKEGNKLLKLIEEPPHGTLFIFVAEDENSMLSTIVSRTQLVKINMLTDQDIENALIAKGIDQSKAHRLSLLSEGNFREALLALQHSEDNLQESLREWLNAIVKVNYAVQVKWIDDVAKTGREKQKQFLKYFIHLLQQAIKVNVCSGGISDYHLPDQDRDFVHRLNKICSIEAQEAIIAELDKACYYIERNAHAKMLFHALTIRLQYIIRDNSIILMD
jgi:DNA polymerase-3 subunit delta'